MTERIGILRDGGMAKGVEAPAAVRLEERDASGYESRPSAATPACGRGGVNDLALVVITTQV
jgi:hypothetical protein